MADQADSSDNSQPDPPQWEPRPDRWAQGDWEYNPGDWRNDPGKDAPWEDPSTWRRKIGTVEELAAVADAIVRGTEIKEKDPDGDEQVIVGRISTGGGILSHFIGPHVIIENLKALIQAVQNHPDARLARVETETDEEGFLRVNRRWVEDARGNELSEGAEPTELFLWGCVIASTAAAGENYWGLDIGIAIRASARFTGMADFSGVIFTGKADFYEARFKGQADFSWASFAEDADFRGGCFSGKADFGGASFAEDADFRGGRFSGKADFGGARFAEDADFYGARFAGEAGFVWIRFAAGADFSEVRFVGKATFTVARFSGKADFSGGRFSGKANFREARFAGEAYFSGARFAEYADFYGACFAGETYFSGARFAEDADFYKARVRRFARLVFQGTRFAKSVRFDGDENNKRPFIRGKISFTEATLDERFTFHNTRFGRHARLNFQNFLARGGATVELDGKQLRLGNPVPEDQTLRRIGAALRGWLWFYNRSGAIMEGADSNKAELQVRADDIDRAAKDYELLAANYTHQPATDREEDGCRWMAHELRRKAEWFRTKAGFLSFLTEPDDKAVNRLLGDRKEGPLLWFLEYVLLILSCFLACFGFFAGWFIAWVWRWLIQRTVVGYLLDWRRTVVSGAVLILAFALIYGCFAGPNTIYYSDDPDLPLRFWNMHPIYNPLYFSVVTFTSLGYGDIQPRGLFKFVTAGEALAGVSLISLFTISWARRMVR